MPTPSPKRVRALTHRPVQLEVRTEDLPPGVCGRVQGIALTYNTRDAYGTVFKPGCLDRTRREKLAAGKIKLLADHESETDDHIGVVRTLDDVGDGVVMTADLFDTAAGRAKLEYLKAVTAAKAFTGLSIGFWDRESEVEKVDPPYESVWGYMRDSQLAYLEIELDEVSLTPSPAVEGAAVTGARHAPETPALLRTALDNLLHALPEDEAVEAFIRAYGDCLFRSFRHTSTVADHEPTWGDVDKTTLPRAAFARRGEADTPSSWGYPHHWVKDGGEPDDHGRYTTGTMYLHQGGLAAAWSAAQGAHTGEKAEAAVIAHLAAHRKALGLDDETQKDSLAASAAASTHGTDAGASDTRNATGGSPAGDRADAGAEDRSAVATMDARLAAVRRSYAH